MSQTDDDVKQRLKAILQGALSGPPPNCKGEKYYATKKTRTLPLRFSGVPERLYGMTGSVMERSHAKLTQGATAFYLAASSKKGASRM
jgi:hypothetical protein